MSYLYGDQLGSVSFATNANGSSTSRQDFDAWGAVRSGGVSATSLNYTGQRLDSTGLLDYHARLYDPMLARFVSADSVVPSSASGGLDGVQRKPLTADFHEPGFVATLNGENSLDFWFQLSGDDRQQAGLPWGPHNPQSLNRYSYVLNAPVRWTDPSGHFAALLAVPFLAITAPAWIVPVTIGVGVIAIGAGLAYAAVQIKNNLEAEAKQRTDTQLAIELKRIPDKWIKELGGEQGFTAGAKSKSGKSKSNLFYDPKTGDVYAVPNNGGEPELVDKLPPEYAPKGRDWS